MSEHLTQFELDRLKERAERYSSYMPVRVGYTDGYMQGIMDAKKDAAEQFVAGMKFAEKNSISEDDQIKFAAKANEVMYAAMRVCVNLMEDAKLEAERIIEGLGASDERGEE